MCCVDRLKWQPKAAVQFNLNLYILNVHFGKANIRYFTRH